LFLPLVVAASACTALAFPLLISARPVSIGTWAGTWLRDENGVSGNLVLRRDTGSQQIIGSYSWNDSSGHLRGSISGATLAGAFEETHYKGDFTLTLSATGESFTGSYAGENKDTGGQVSGPFDGTCVAGACLQNSVAEPVVPTPPTKKQQCDAALAYGRQAVADGTEILALVKTKKLVLIPHLDSTGFASAKAVSAEEITQAALLKVAEGKLDAAGLRDVLKGVSSLRAATLQSLTSTLADMKNKLAEAEKYCAGVK
jgi:hypothetical protein